MSDALVRELRQRVADLQLENARLRREIQELRGGGRRPAGRARTRDTQRQGATVAGGPSSAAAQAEDHPLPGRPLGKRPNHISHDLWMPEPNSGCWLWLGKTKNGRAKFRNLYAARAMWRMLHGVPPLGYVYHTCGNLLCVNPSRQINL
jgi:hypothetical protein